MGRMRDAIERKLSDALSPVHLVVEDESHGHNVPEGAESHFKVVLASAEFLGLMPVKRHQKVYGILQEELQASVHALALHLYTPDEWQAKGEAPASPNCLGGSKSS